MSTGKKIFVWLLVSPFLLFFIFSIIWDPNWFRGQAEPHLEDIEGHQVDFASLEHSLFDPGYLEVQDITIKGAFMNGSLGTLIVDGSIKDALNKDIVIRQITLKDTDLNIDMLTFQQWQENQAQEEEEIVVSSDTQSDGFPVNKIYIEKIALKNAKVRDTSELKQFLVAGLNITLSELNIAENAEIVLGLPDYPVNLTLEAKQLQAMSSPDAQLFSQMVATRDLITLREINLTTQKSQLKLNALLRNPKTNAEIQMVLQDSQITLDEFAHMKPDLPIDAKGTLDINGEVYAKGRLDEPDTLMATLASNLNLVLDTGSSKVDLAAELRTETFQETDSTEVVEIAEIAKVPEMASDAQVNQANIKLHIKDSHISLTELAPLLKDLPITPSGDVKLFGLVNTSGNLEDSNSLLAALNGDVEIIMQQGNLQGIDVNQIVSSFKESKETDLLDVGSFLLTGPIGILASNLLDLAGAAKFEGDTQLPQLHVKGKMENGSINLHNTALATDVYRLAFDGAINPGKGTFEDFTFAILDEEGCADIKQTLNGEFTQPTSAVAKSLLDSALAPVTGLVNSVKNTAVECTPIYDGEVQHPAK